MTDGRKGQSPMQYSNRGSRDASFPGPAASLHRLKTADGVQTCPCEKYRTLCRAAAARRSVHGCSGSARTQSARKFDLYRRAEGRASAEHRQPQVAMRRLQISGLRQVGLDSQYCAPNTWGDSVLTLFEYGGRRCLAVGVTLEEDGALFPDAPTLRGIKHHWRAFHAPRLRALHYHAVRR